MGSFILVYCFCGRVWRDQWQSRRRIRIGAREKDECNRLLQFHIWNSVIVKSQNSNQLCDRSRNMFFLFPWNCPPTHFGFPPQSISNLIRTFSKSPSIGKSLHRWVLAVQHRHAMCCLIIYRTFAIGCICITKNVAMYLFSATSAPTTLIRWASCRLEIMADCDLDAECLHQTSGQTTSLAGVSKHKIKNLTVWNLVSAFWYSNRREYNGGDDWCLFYTLIIIS